MRIRMYDADLVGRLQKAAKERAVRSGVKGLQKRWWGSPKIVSRTRFWQLWLGYMAIRVMAERLRDPMGAEMASGCASLVFAGIALWRMKSLRKALTRSVERVQTYFYPISEGEFAERTLFKAGANLWWLLAISVGIFRLLQTGNSATVWVTAALAGIVETLVVLGLVYGLEVYVDVIPRWLPLGFFGMAVAWLYTPQKYAQGQQPWVNGLPTGWASLVMTSSWSAEARIWTLGGGVVAFGGAAWYLGRRRRSGLIREFEASVEVGKEIPPGELQRSEEQPSETWRVLEESDTANADEEADAEADVVQPLPLQVTWQRQRIEAIGTEWGEIVRQGEWLQRWDWSQMPLIERVVGWWLSEEEKDTLWFLTGAKLPQWSNGWKNSVIALAVGLLLTIVLPSEWRLLGVIAFLAAFGLGLPVAGGAWAATSQGWISGKRSPIYAVYPLDYGRASRVMAKVNLVRTAAWLPLVVLLAVVNAKLANEGIGERLWMAARIVLLWFSWMPIAIAGKFSKGTNDTTLLRARQIFVIPVFILVVSGGVILWGTILIVDRPEVLIGAVAGIAASVGAWAGYGWWYKRKVDLLRDRD